MIARLADAVATYFLGARCPICGERTRLLGPHAYVNHAGEDQ